MTSTSWIVLCVFLIVLAGVIGIYLYQKSQVDKAQINANKLAILNASLNGTLGYGSQQGGFGGWLNSLVGGTLNSSAVSAFGAGLGKAAPLLV